MLNRNSSVLGFLLLRVDLRKDRTFNGRRQMGQFGCWLFESVHRLFQPFADGTCQPPSVGHHVLLGVRLLPVRTDPFLQVHRSVLVDTICLCCRHFRLHHFLPTRTGSDSVLYRRWYVSVVHRQPEVYRFPVFSELFLVGPRPAAMSIGSIASWSGNFLVGMTFPTLSLLWGAWVFLPFTVVCFSLTLLLKVYLPETRGRDIADIVPLVSQGFQSTPLRAS